MRCAVKKSELLLCLIWHWWLFDNYVDWELNYKQIKISFFWTQLSNDDLREAGRACCREEVDVVIIAEITSYNISSERQNDVVADDDDNVCGQPHLTDLFVWVYTRSASTTKLRKRLANIYVFSPLPFILGDPSGVCFWCWLVHNVCKQASLQNLANFIATMKRRTAK